MPKSYSEKERNYIIKKLKEEAKQLFIQYGAKKTTVDEIVKRVNIPKGTFYLFYKSKELLLFDIILEEQAVIQSELISLVAKAGAGLTKESFSELIFNVCQSTTNSFLFPIFTNGEYELILRKLPPEALNENMEEDDLSMEMLFALIPQAKNKDISVYSAAFRGIVLMALHQKEIGEEVYEKTLKLLIDGISTMIFEEEV